MRERESSPKTIHSSQSTPQLSEETNSETNPTKNIRYPKLMHINWHAARPCVKIFNKNTDNNEVAVVSIAQESFWVAWFLVSLYFSPFILISVHGAMTRTGHCSRCDFILLVWCAMSDTNTFVKCTAYNNSEKCIVPFSHIHTMPSNYRKIILSKINPQMLNLLFHEDREKKVILNCKPNELQ